MAKNIKFQPDGFSPKELFISWLEYNDLTWAERQNDGSFTVISELAPELEQNLIALLSALFPGAIVTEVELTRPSGTVAKHEETWYQYQARMKALTRHRVTTDIHDTVLGFGETDGVFTYALRRVDYRETIKRDVVTGTRFQINTIQKIDGKWEHTETSWEETELAPDSLKFGTVLSPGQYWQKLQADLPYLSASEQSALAFMAKIGGIVK